MNTGAIMAIKWDLDYSKGGKSNKGKKRKKCLYCGDIFLTDKKSLFCSERCKNLYKKEGKQ
jgi:hypothetical protein